MIYLGKQKGRRVQKQTRYKWKVMCRKDCLALLQVPVTDLPLCINTQQMVQSVRYRSIEAKQTVLHIKQSAGAGNKSRIS